MDVAFDPGDPQRGYAVGKGGVAAAYGKSWTQEPLPPGFERADLTQIAFAGSQAIVAAGTRSARQRRRGLARRPERARPAAPADATAAQLFAVAGLPDGGAVAAGRDVVIERDGPGSPWRFSDQPLPGSTVIAAAARTATAAACARWCRSCRSCATRRATDSRRPTRTCRRRSCRRSRCPGDGYVLRETGEGWRDEQHTAFAGSGPGPPDQVRPDPGFAARPERATAGRSAAGAARPTAPGAARRGATRSGQRGRARACRPPASTATATVGRAARASARPGVRSDGGRGALRGRRARPVRAGLRRPRAAGDLGPDRTLAGVPSPSPACMRAAGGPAGAALHRRPARRPAVDARVGAASASRYAELLSAAAGLPVFPAVSATDAARRDRRVPAPRSPASPRRSARRRAAGRAPVRRAARLACRRAHALRVRLARAPAAPCA